MYISDDSHMQWERKEFETHMELLLFIDTLSRVTHVSTAIVLVGGTVFVLFVLIPATSSLLDKEEKPLRANVQQRWKRFVHVGIVLFIISGFYNFIRAIPDHTGDGLYHALIGTKILLAFGMFFIASVLVGHSSAFHTMRKNRVFWLRVLVLLAFSIVAISGFVKVRGTPEKPAAAEITR